MAAVRSVRVLTVLVNRAVPGMGRLVLSTYISHAYIIFPICDGGGAAFQNPRLRSNSKLYELQVEASEGASRLRCFVQRVLQHRCTPSDTLLGKIACRSGSSSPHHLLWVFVSLVTLFCLGCFAFCWCAGGGRNQPRGVGEGAPRLAHVAGRLVLLPPICLGTSEQ